MDTEKILILYYEMVQMQKILAEEAELILKSKTEITSALNRFEILQRELILKLDSRY